MNTQGAHSCQLYLYKTSAMLRSPAAAATGTRGLDGGAQKRPRSFPFSARVSESINAQKLQRETSSLRLWSFSCLHVAFHVYSCGQPTGIACSSLKPSLSFPQGRETKHISHLSSRLSALPLQQDLELVRERRDPVRLVAAAALKPIPRFGYR